MTDTKENREKITQYCSVCNSIVETEIIFDYPLNVDCQDELFCEGTIIKLAKCLNCKNPILLAEDFTEIEGNHYTQNIIQLFPDKESDFVKNTPKTIIKPYREAKKCYKANAYEACVIMCRKGIEAICHEKGEVKGNLINKLKKLKEIGILEETFYKWANELREIGNIGAHSHDTEISKQDSIDTLEFFEALILYLYHLVDKYDRLIERKNKARP